MVTVRVLPTNLSSNGQLRLLFFRNEQPFTLLDQENVAMTIAFVDVEDRLATVSEYVDGTPLARFREDCSLQETTTIYFGI